MKKVLIVLISLLFLILSSFSYSVNCHTVSKRIRQGLGIAGVGCLIAGVAFSTQASDEAMSQNLLLSNTLHNCLNATTVCSTYDALHEKARVLILSAVGAGLSLASYYLCACDVPTLDERARLNPRGAERGSPRARAELLPSYGSQVEPSAPPLREDENVEPSNQPLRENENVEPSAPPFEVNYTRGRSHSAPAPEIVR